MENPKRYFQRFTLNQRAQHVILIVSLIVLVLTGFPLKYAESDISQSLVNLMGGWEMRGYIHRAAAVALGSLGIFHIVSFVASRKRSTKMLPRLKDIKDFGGYLKYLVGRGEHPKYDRFSWKEKFEYWGIVWGMIIMGVTGIMMMYPSDSARIFGSPAWVEVAWSAHSYEAFLAVMAIIIWHFWSVHFNPKKFPMNKVWLTGKLSEEEMKEEHPLEYEAMVMEAKGSDGGQ